jgi:AcrR family transcriptional regulator
VARRYELKRRAERQLETRRRIAEAALRLHAEVGPARTTVSDIARLAGVQRHTYYRHFPDERSLVAACSGLHWERNPMPDPEGWLEVAGAEQRLRRALAELYAYYAEHEALLANLARDADVHVATREILAARRARHAARMRDALVEPFAARRRRRARIEAAVALALDFRTWRQLVRAGGLPVEEAIEVAVGAVRGQ